MSRYVYVAGPYTGDEEGNVARALAAATKLLGAGLYPYVPHLSHYWEAQHAHHYEVWMELDFGWVRRCDAVLRLPGPSKGADREVALAERLGLPVFASVEAVLAWAAASPGPEPRAMEEIERLVVEAMSAAVAFVKKASEQDTPSLVQVHAQKTAVLAAIRRALGAASPGERGPSLPPQTYEDGFRECRVAAECCVEAEEELSGPMPEAMLSALRERPEDVLRATVRTTKDGILARVQTLRPMLAAPVAPPAPSGPEEAKRCQSRSDDNDQCCLHEGHNGQHESLDPVEGSYTWCPDCGGYDGGHLKRACIRPAPAPVAASGDERCPACQGDPCEPDCKAREAAPCRYCGQLVCDGRCEGEP